MFQEIEVLQLLEAGLYLLDGKQQPDRLHPAATSHQLIEADGIVSVLCGVQRTRFAKLPSTWSDNLADTIVPSPTGLGKRRSCVTQL